MMAGALVGVSAAAAVCIWRSRDLWSLPVEKFDGRKFLRQVLPLLFGFGIWIPTVDFPGMRSMMTDSACMARQRSSASPVILLYFTPASGLNS